MCRAAKRSPGLDANAYARLGQQKAVKGSNSFSDLKNGIFSDSIISVISPTDARIIMSHNEIRISMPHTSLMTEERKRLIQWLETPRNQICPKCYAKFKAVVEFDSDVFDVLCQKCRSN